MRLPTEHTTPSNSADTERQQWEREEEEGCEEGQVRSHSRCPGSPCFSVDISNREVSNRQESKGKGMSKHSAAAQRKAGMDSSQRWSLHVCGKALPLHQPGKIPSPFCLGADQQGD